MYGAGSYVYCILDLQCTTVAKIQQENIDRAGHVTTLPRQRDHIFRPNNCCLLLYAAATPFRHRALTLLEFFCHRSSKMSHCHGRCHEAKKLSRAQLWK